MQKIIPFKKEIAFKDNVSEITSISLEHTLHIDHDNIITGEFLISGEYKVVDTSSVIDNFSFHLPFDINMDDKYDTSHIQIDIDDFYYEIINNNALLVNIDVLVDKIEEIKKEKEEREVVSEVEGNLEKVVCEDTRESQSLLKEIYKENEEREEKITENKKEDVYDELSSINISSLEGLDEVDRKKDEIVSLVQEELVPSSSFPTSDIEDQSVSSVSSLSNEAIMESSSSILDIEKEHTKTVSSVNDKASSIFDAIENREDEVSTYHIYIVRDGDTIDTILEKYGVNRESVESYNDLHEIKVGDKLVIPCVNREKV